MRQASRLLRMKPDNVTKLDAMTLVMEDFEIQSMETTVRKIGFID